jgi:alanine racemase
VDLGAVERNCRRLRELLTGDAALCAVVKADGYGHGATAVGGAALDAGAARLCVATLVEAVALRRELPEAPVLVMSPLGPGEEAEVAGLDVAVSSVEGFARLRAGVREPAGVHVKYDSGMGRWGMTADEALRVGEELAGSDGRLRLAGLMSHLACAECDDDFTARQLERFEALSQRFPPCPRHVANTAAALRRPDARYDAVRSGVGVYGLHPAGGDPAEYGLRPVLGFQSYVAQVKRIDPGESSGYGRRFVADRPTWVGLAPAGYADGVPRLLSGRMEVLVRGRRRPVAATISMDQLTFVIGEECDVEPGDRVVLIGRDGDECVRAEEWARLSETINYEVVSDIAPRRRRVEHVVVGA